jgi:cysteinyl-tRNA synthetase
MSKSEGNFFTIQDVLKDWPGEVVRFNMLKTHYRQPIDWTVRGLEEARVILAGWGAALRPYGKIELSPQLEIPILDEVTDALADDLNMQPALVLMHGWAKDARAGNQRSAAALQFAGTFLGLSPERWDRGFDDVSFKVETNDGVQSKIDARIAARAAKNFAESDRIRDELFAMGIQLKDGKDPVTGEPVTTWEAMR